MNSPTEGRVPVLDGIRGIAILLVLVHHVIIFSGMAREAVLDRAIHALGASAWLGVDLFFVLSGFLITGILYDAKSSRNYFSSFYARRILRIFPLYYGFLTLWMLIVPLWATGEAAQMMTGGIGWHWAYLSNVKVAIAGWQQPLHLGHFWSLAVEEQFYLLWPMVVHACDRRRLMQVTIVCFAAAFMIRAVAPFGLSPVGASVLMPTRLDSLAAGALLALVVRGARTHAVDGWPRTLLAGSLAAASIIFVWRRGFGEADSVVVVLGLSVFAVGFASLIGLALAADPRARLSRLLSSPLLVALGQYSYGLYVFHQPIILMLRDRGWQADMLPRLWGSELPGIFAFGIVAGALSIGCAVASWHLWELPFLRLKRYLPYHPTPPIVTLESAPAVRRDRIAT